MGKRKIVVKDENIVRNSHQWPPYVPFRPDVMLTGDILEDPAYQVVMVETDGIMEIKINKTDGKGRGGKKG